MDKERITLTVNGKDFNGKIVSGTKGQTGTPGLAG